MQTYSPITVITGRASGITEPARIGCGRSEGATTRGHSAGQGGLRGHSIGEFYPWRVIGFGDGSWAVSSSQGDILARFYPRDEDPEDHHLYLAHAQARAFKTLHPQGHVEFTPGGNPANISGPLDSIAERLEGRLLVVGYPTGARDKLRVCHQQGQCLRVLNHSTGLVSLVSIPWLAHNQNLSVSLDITDFIE